MAQTIFVIFVVLIVLSWVLGAARGRRHRRDGGEAPTLQGPYGESGAGHHTHHHGDSGAGHHGGSGGGHVH